MRTLEELYPPLGVGIRMGDLELRLPTDADLPEVIQLAKDGIHEPDRMPFVVPWTRLSGAAFDKNYVEHAGRGRSGGPDEWDLDFLVFRDGVLVGRQSLGAKDFLICKQVGTGSWLGLAHHGQGIGTRMRQAVLSLGFDRLGAEIATSGAFEDNPASLALSHKLGYRDNGRHRTVREGTCAWERYLTLDPADFVRPTEPISYRGVEAFRRFIGLDPETSQG